MSMLQLSMRQLNSDQRILDSEAVHLTDQIATMMEKETSVYKCNDYIMSHNLNKETMPNLVPSDSDQEDFIVDDLSRQKMCEWSFRVVDHFKGGRGLVAIAQNYVDRFLDQYRCDCSGYQLASITSLYLAVKIHNSKPFSMTSLANLSKGRFLIKDIEEMETVLLNALGWKMSPPTASCFCGYFQALLSPNIKSSVRQTILQRSYFFSELSVMDYSFMVSLKQSEVAFAAIINSLAGLSASLISNSEKQDFIKDIEERTALDHKSERIIMAKEKLWALYRRSTQFKVHDNSSLTIDYNMEEVEDPRVTNQNNTPRQTDVSFRDGSFREVSPICITSRE